MSDPFQGWLDLQRALKDTSANVKWDTVNPARDIHKLRAAFVIPAFALENTEITNTSYICQQFNYTMAQRFTIAPFPKGVSSNLFYCFIAIRYRIGTQVFRYNLTNINDILFPVNFSHNYTGQVIEKNFCVEVWTEKVIDNTTRTVLNTSNLLINTSILSVPAGACSTVPQVQPLQTVPISSLFNSFPSDNPALFNDAGPWLTN